MANEMPDPAQYRGLSRKVLQYSAAFLQIANRLKQPGFSEADWTPLEALIDVGNFRRVGVFLTNAIEVSNWQHYKKLLMEYGGTTAWEGTLRRITELPGLVFLELEERNTRDGVMDVSNTVTIYKFNAAGLLSQLDVYVAHKGTRTVAAQRDEFSIESTSTTHARIFGNEKVKAPVESAPAPAPAPPPQRPLKSTSDLHALSTRIKEQRGSTDTSAKPRK
jgi:hypothetical protein